MDAVHGKEGDDDIIDVVRSEVHNNSSENGN